MDSNGVLSKEEIQNIIEIQSRAIIKITDRLRDIFDPTKILTDASGNISKTSIDRMRKEVIDLLKERADSPNILNHMDDPSLRDIHNIGTSFEICNIIGASVVVPMIRQFGFLSPQVATKIMMTIFEEILSPSQEPIGEIIFKNLKMSRTTQDGTPILDPDADNHKRVIISNLCDLTFSNLTINEIITISKEEQTGNGLIQITEFGLKVLSHLGAADALLNIVEHSMMANAMTENKSELTEE